MAHIFKKYNPITKEKGIFVITHKEIDTFKSVPEEIQARYFIGIYYGSASWVKGAIRQPYQQFCLGTETLVSYEENPPFRIPYTSRAFTPEFFHKDESIPKYWDVINISRNHKIKCLRSFLFAIRKLYDKGHKLKVLLIVPSSYNETSETHYTELVEVYRELFNRQERLSFTLMRLSPELGFLGISLSTIAHFYKSSKVACLFSLQEGEPRVVHEAILCGLPVVCYSKLVGAGRDYLDKTNSFQFDDYEESYLSILKAVESVDAGLNIDSEVLAEELREDKTLPKMEACFKQLYQQYGETYITPMINTDEMNLRLPGHYLDLPWAEGGNGVTADIETPEQRERFFKEL